MKLILKDIKYVHSGSQTLFDNISLTLSKGEKASLVGNNGIGKTTLLRISAGELTSSSGVINISENHYYVPQHFDQYDNMSVASALSVENKITALHYLLSGDLSEGNYAVLNDDWDIENRVVSSLGIWGLDGIEGSRRMSELSGGEKTKVFLSGISIHNPDVILLDEPTNHLDGEGRERLYEFIKSSKATILVVSHDRTLLNLLDTTLEMSRGGIKRYGGNYEFYKQCKHAEEKALGRTIQDKEKALAGIRRVARESIQRKEKKSARAPEKLAKEGIPRIAINTIRSAAEVSNAKLKGVHQDKIDTIKKEISDLRGKEPSSVKVKIKLDNRKNYEGKLLFEADAINFKYGEKLIWSKPLDLVIRSGERIRIKGNNGSGKTTLLRLILGEKEPVSGTVRRYDFRYICIDQQYSLIDDSLTVLEQVDKYNIRKMADHELKTELHRFLFPHDTWDKKCRVLSGGEKMKLTLCCLVVTDSAPEVFVLDEPTNNLDIESLAIMTNTIKQYKGTLLIVSHDDYFCEEVGITSEIEL